jgi:protein-S-isoprenylcysteine O-methyltransferase Ste14
MLGAFAAPLLWGASSLSLAGPLQIAGAALVAAGAAFAGAGLASLGRALTPFPRPLDDASLRQSGIYGWVRHPIYSGLVLGSFGWALMWLSAAGAVASVVAFFFFDRKSAYEERMLRARFPEYADYARRVKKLLPGIY